MKYYIGKIVERWNKKFKIVSVIPYKHPISKKITAYHVQGQNIKKNGSLGSYYVSFWSDNPIATTKISVIRRHR